MALAPQMLETHHLIEPNHIITHSQPSTHKHRSPSNIVGSIDVQQPHIPYQPPQNVARIHVQPDVVQEIPNIDSAVETPSRSRKRKRSASTTLAKMKKSQSEDKETASSPSLQHDDANESKPPTFKSVRFGSWLLIPWYYSPYPEPDEDDPDNPKDHMPTKDPKKYSQHHSMQKTPSSSIASQTLSVCDRCFKYVRDHQLMKQHRRICTASRPPGRKVYSHNSESIWEIDGRDDKSYCQRLSLFGKLFIHEKTMCAHTDRLLFYVVTKYEGDREHVVGYFCKEQWSFDGYNLSCVITFPHHQKKGYGRLMIEFSYELSRRQGVIGSPERPLSALGQASYLAYWTREIVYFLSQQVRLPDPPFEEDKPPTKPYFRDVMDAQGNPEVYLITPFPLEDDAFVEHRNYPFERFPDGSVHVHSLIKSTIKWISEFAKLQEDDIAYALATTGLLDLRKAHDGGSEIYISTKLLDEYLAKHPQQYRMDSSSVLL